MDPPRLGGREKMGFMPRHCRNRRLAVKAAMNRDACIFMGVSSDADPDLRANAAVNRDAGLEREGRLRLGAARLGRRRFGGDHGERQE